MITLRKSKERGHANHGWLESYFSFSFADYYDPNWMGFRSLRVINDDIVFPLGGFGTHPHRDMEIITYVLSGSLQHKDSMGNGRVIRTGEFQYMAAGTGVTHSEYNPSDVEAVHLLQIWIMPDHRAAAPRYEEKIMTDAAVGQFHLIASKSGREGSIAINQQSDLYLGKLEAGTQLSHTLEAGRHVWLHVAEGEITLNGTRLEAGDAAAVTDETALALTGIKTAQVLLFELN